MWTGGKEGGKKEGGRKGGGRQREGRRGVLQRDANQGRQPSGKTQHQDTSHVVLDGAFQGLAPAVSGTEAPCPLLLCWYLMLVQKP